MEQKYFEFAQTKEKELQWVNKNLEEKNKLFVNMA